jgi:hypothetical protein
VYKRQVLNVRLENRFLQALLVVTVGILSFFLVNMFDRFDARFDDLDSSIDELEDENKERDYKLAELVLNIESRLATLEAQ